MRRLAIALILLLVTDCSPPKRLHIDDNISIIYRRVNQLRIAHGLPPLQYLTETQQSADLWAKRLESRFRHAPPVYSCENIAYNFTGAEELFSQWLHSPGHKRNMLMWRIRYCTISVHIGTRDGIYPTYFGVFRGYDAELAKRKKRK
ncbi:CAP domain-containing protein [Chryseolinea sp. T2]|uniref:CAP domain-containing protein n=1 Tax=Chryseolinea sp. T2 TaxID=3129255 RepID=UPI003076F982